MSQIAPRVPRANIETALARCEGGLAAIENCLHSADKGAAFLREYQRNRTGIAELIDHVTLSGNVPAATAQRQERDFQHHVGGLLAQNAVLNQQGPGRTARQRMEAIQADLQARAAVLRGTPALADTDAFFKPQQELTPHTVGYRLLGPEDGGGTPAHQTHMANFKQQAACTALCFATAFTTLDAIQRVQRMMAAEHRRQAFAQAYVNRREKVVAFRMHRLATEAGAAMPEDDAWPFAPAAPANPGSVAPWQTPAWFLPVNPSLRSRLIEAADQETAHLTDCAHRSAIWSPGLDFALPPQEAHTVLAHINGIAAPHCPPGIGLVSTVAVLPTLCIAMAVFRCIQLALETGRRGQPV